MAHQHVIRKSPNPFANIPIHVDEYRESTPPAPDPFLPLLNRDTPAKFLRKLDGRRLTGHVFSQSMESGGHKNHGSFFYVEWPADSADFHEVSAQHLCRVLGGGKCNRTFTREEFASLLTSVPPAMEMAKLLHAIRPQAS